jgi:hypothetical protein
MAVFAVLTTANGTGILGTVTSDYPIAPAFCQRNDDNDDNLYGTPLKL